MTAAGFDSFDHSGFDSFIHSGFDARGGTSCSPLLPGFGPNQSWRCTAVWSGVSIDRHYDYYYGKTPAHLGPNEPCIGKYKVLSFDYGTAFNKTFTQTQDVFSGQTSITYSFPISVPSTTQVLLNPPCDGYPITPGGTTPLVITVSQSQISASWGAIVYGQSVCANVPLDFQEYDYEETFSDGCYIYSGVLTYRTCISGVQSYSFFNMETFRGTFGTMAITMTKL